jgi:hypothetical protein
MSRKSVQRFCDDDVRNIQRPKVREANLKDRDEL